MKMIHAVIKPFKLDEVRAISAHLVAGIWGTLAVGIFGSGDFVVQLIGVLAVGAFVMIASAIVWFAIRAVIGLRIDEEAERLELDQVELGIEGLCRVRHGVAIDLSFPA